MTVLVGYAPRPEGRRALEAGIAEARLRDAPLRVVSVLVHDPGDSSTGARRDLEAAVVTREHLDHLRDELADEGVRADVEVLHGLPGGEAQLLLEEADRSGAQLLVIGLRRRSRVGKLVLGSVAQDLLLGAACPVLAVKADAVDA